MLPSVLKSWRVPTLQIPIKVFKDGLNMMSKDNILTHVQRYLTTELPNSAVPQSQAVSARHSKDLNLKGPEFLFFWEKLKKCFGFGTKKGGKEKGKSGKKTKKQTCKGGKGKCANQKSTCMKKKNEDKCKSKQEEKPKPDCKKAEKKKADPCKKKEEKKADPCKKTDEKKADPCKKDVKKADPCKKKEEKKADPCKKEEKKADPCKKKEEKKSDPCKREEKKADPCKKKEEKKADPCKKDDKKKEDPCKKKEDPCKKKEDPCKKKEDPCEKKEDPCKKKEDPCKKKEDPCKKKDDPCKKKEEPCKKKDEKKDDPCKKKEDPCKKKDDPCKKKEDPCKKKEDPCKKKEDPCKKKDDKKDDPCKKKEDPCKKKDPCGDKFVSNESLSTDPILLFSVSKPILKKEEGEVRETCKDPCAQGACDVLPGQDEPCASSVSWKVKVNPCRQRSSSGKRKCPPNATACIVDAKDKKEEKLEHPKDCGISAHPCGKKVCPNKCEVKKTKCSSVAESFDLGVFNYVNVVAVQAIDILSLAVNFASQKGLPVNQRPPSSQAGVPGNTPAPSVAQKVSGIVGKIKDLWNGPEQSTRLKDKQPRTTNVPVNTPGRSPGRYPTKQRFEGLNADMNGLSNEVGTSQKLPELATNGGFVYALGQDDFEKCEDRVPPCPAEIETMPCPRPVDDCQKVPEDVWSDIDESYGYEKFPFKQEQTHGDPLEVVSLKPDDPYSNGHL